MEPKSGCVDWLKVVISYSLHAEVLAHAVVVPEHVLEGREVKFVVVLREFSVADGVVLVHDASDFHHGSRSHALGVSLELYYLDRRI